VGDYSYSCFTAVLTYSQPNIFIDITGHAQITDLSLATIIQDTDSLANTTYHQGHAPRWTAPEILWFGSPANKKSDVFSFGMVIIEVWNHQSILY